MLAKGVVRVVNVTTTAKSLDDNCHDVETTLHGRYHDGGRLADQQMALLQYQRENLHFLSEEVLMILINGTV